MNNEALTNPYRTALHGQDVAPFAGRNQALAWLHQHLFETHTVGGLLFTGRHDIGKSSLLQNLNHAYDDLFVGVYIPLEDNPIEDESDWLLTLAQNATAEIAERGYPLTRLSTLEPPSDDIRGWFANQFLPEALAIIRPQRRLVFLIDDAQMLVRAADNDQLEAEPFVYLRNLLDQHRQLAFVLAVSSENDADINALAPLVRRHDAYRLTNLRAEDTAELLQAPVSSLYQVPEPTAAAIYRATGGVPLLLQHFGSALYWRWEEEPSINVMTTDDARMVTAAVAKRADEIFDNIWHKLKPNEQLVLSAVSHLVYRDPLRPVDISAIETWLIETDYPLDRIAIGAAIRSLEYEELITTGHNGISLGSGLLQSWLLENSTHSPLQSSEPQDHLPPESRIRRLQLIILALALVVVAVLILVALSNSPRPVEPQILQPTVTLVDGR